MGKRGFPARPTQLKILLGNPGHQTLNKEEPQAPSGEPPRPPGMDAPGRRFWRRCVEDLQKLGLLYETDGAVLEQACLSYGRQQEARKALKGKAQTFKTASGYVALRPEVGIMQREAVIVRGLLAEMGLTASARSRIHAPQAEREDELDALLG